jgi:HEAT repeat protein
MKQISTILLLLIASAPLSYGEGNDVVAQPDAAEINSLIARLGSREPKDAGVEANLRHAGSRAVPGLIDALSSRDYLTRDRAAQALGMIGEGSAVPALVTMAEQKEDRYKLALDALGAIGGPDAAAYLLAALPKEPPQNQPDMIRDLGLIGDNRAVPSLCGVLKDSGNTRLRRPAAEALGRFRDPRSRAALQHAVAHDSDWDVYRTAKKSLLRLASGKEPADQHREFRRLVEIIVWKLPEAPEGAPEWLRRYQKAHPPSPKAPFDAGAPTVHSCSVPRSFREVSLIGCRLKREARTES